MPGPDGAATVLFRILPVALARFGRKLREACEGSPSGEGLARTSFGSVVTCWRCDPWNPFVAPRRGISDVSGASFLAYAQTPVSRCPTTQKC